MREPNSVNPLEQPQRLALRHHVVHSLLTAIIQGELAAGTRLITSKLAIRFGVSATPVREALVELEQSGNVEILHHRGAVVKPFGRKEVRDFYAVRRLLECEAVRLACCHVDHELLSSLRSELEPFLGESGNGRGTWIKDLLAVDRRIHRMAVDHCSNRRLAAEIDRLRIVSETMRDVVEFDHNRHKGAVVPLLDVLDAMRQHRVEAGADAMERHINLVATTVETVMFDESPINRPGNASGPETPPRSGEGRR